MKQISAIFSSNYIGLMILSKPGESWTTVERVLSVSTDLATLLSGELLVLNPPVEINYYPVLYPNIKAELESYGAR